MADSPGSLIRLREHSQRSLGSFVTIALSEHKSYSELRNKLEVIDIAYARYKELTAQNSQGVDIYNYGNTQCSIGPEDIVAPIVVSQVDTYVGYLCDVFLSGYPIFPVVSNYKNKSAAEKLQAIIDTHSNIGGYIAELAMFIRDAVKYNFSALVIDWATYENWSPIADMMKPLENKKVQRQGIGYNCVKRFDPYNTVWDYRVAPSLVSQQGTYAGQIEAITRVELKRRLHAMEKNFAYNTTKAQFATSRATAGSVGPNYTVHPTISALISPQTAKNFGQPNWEAWLNADKKKQPVGDYSSMYEWTTLYAKIIPEEHGIESQDAKRPQIWKLCAVNDYLVYAKRLVTLEDRLPVYFGQAIEDGFGIQTQSIAENQIPFQEAVTYLFSIRFNAARRAVSDRALYDPSVISPKDINSPVPASKIPFNASALLGGKTLDTIYRQIPFDPRGTETTLQDASLIMQMSDQLSGANKPSGGQFQKGNKSVKEWVDTMAGSDNKMRMPALVLEARVFMPLKGQIKLNIFQFAESGSYYNVKQKTTYSLKASEIQDIFTKMIEFKIADGYTPSARIANTEVILRGMDMIQNSPMLQQSFGSMLPSMFLHFMSLAGLHDMEQYDPANLQAVEDNTESEDNDADDRAPDPAQGVPAGPAPAALPAPATPPPTGP